MATRSTIALEFADGTVGQVYCHWDGYPENNGLLLLNYWNDQYLAECLMSLGDLSYLGKQIGERQNFDQPTDRDWCLAYGRDRGEKNSLAELYSSASNFISEAASDYGVDYIYLFDNGNWRCWNYEGQEFELAALV